MHDRLAELTGRSSDVTIDMSETSSEIARPKFMEKFFVDVEDMQADLNKIVLATDRICELNHQALIATAAGEEQTISQELCLVIDGTNKIAAHGKGLLELIKKESAEKKKDKNVAASEIRIRDNMSTTLTRKFMDTMKEYQKAQQKFKADMKNKVKRQVQIVKPDASEQEIDMVMRSADPGAIYRSAILQGSAESIKEVYMNCHDKYQDVLKLEQSVAELHQMFLDLALLVEQQGEMLDQIEFQVKAASNYIESGNKEVTKAIQSQKSLRKKQCCLLMFGLVIILVIVLAAGVFK
ncbi:syntaxin [Thraustotheca clavata]|uniref:Syntaxin n=1 Tax=Thraustotheca clavata TaxID=74557 RepID=A0A1V9YVC5_9STRA|nr:syntaxin [Thraustotheca clavata]